MHVDFIFTIDSWRQVFCTNSAFIGLVLDLAVSVKYLLKLSLNLSVCTKLYSTIPHLPVSCCYIFIPLLFHFDMDLP